MPYRLQSLWRYLKELLQELGGARQAARDDGVPVLRQLLELLLLRLGPGKLSPHDYYLMRIYRKNLNIADKRKYLSLQAMQVVSRDRRWDVVADDKLLAYSVLLSQGICVPEVYAIFHPSRAYGYCPALRSVDELKVLCWMA